MVPGEALVGELRATIGTLETAGVPRSLQHLQDKPIQDGLGAPRALGDGGCGGEKGGELVKAGEEWRRVGEERSGVRRKGGELWRRVKSGWGERSRVERKEGEKGEALVAVEEERERWGGSKWWLGRKDG